MNNLEVKFDEIYKVNYPRVIRICLGYCGGDEMLAKDLAQEVFIKVWQHLGAFRNESSIATWIYRITVNTCLLSKRAKKEQTLLVDITLSEEEDENSIAQQGEEKIKRLYNCIHKLSQDNKAIIMLELEGLPQKEIAKIIGLSHEAIRVRIHRIKNELTKCVKNERL